VDYLDGAKVLMSHMSHDTCTYFAHFVVLLRLPGPEWMSALGHVPLPYAHYASEETVDPVLVPAFLHPRELLSRHLSDKPVGINPVQRTSVVRTFYRETDFSGLFNDRVWHKPGVFR